MSLAVKVASGFEASQAGGQGKSARELAGLVRHGLFPSGALEAGKYAGMIADPIAGITILQQVKFVMKGAQ